MKSTFDIVKQAAAIPLRDGRICVVTAVTGKGWVIPKGCQEEGHSEQETAKQEAWEEAGLIGTLSPQPVGSYQYEKAGKLCQVAVFLMQVTEEADNWPERSQRERRWLPPAEAVSLILEPRLREVIQSALEKENHG
jgi:8-oxo-dGTP pyrophosphatase MutT (NUDIX family)